MFKSNSETLERLSLQLWSSDPYQHAERWRRESTLAFVFIASILLLLSYIIDLRVFPYDAGLYWTLSKPSDLAAFPNTYRGYVWPYILMPAHAVDGWIGKSSLLGYRIFSSIFYSYLLTGPVANFFRRAFGGRLSIARRSWIAIATIIVYPGLFLYPLSDLPALLLLICGILLADSRQSRQWVLACVSSGALIAAAYNIRTIYLMAFAAVLLLIPFFFYRTCRIRIRALALLSFLLGASIVCVPQMVINENTHDTLTPFVQTGEGSTSLMADQLYWGLTIQRYETTIQPNAPSAGLYYADSVGIAFRSKHKKFFSERTIYKYIAEVARDPLFALGVYGRHFINGIDVRDGMVYTNSSSTEKVLRSVFCISLFAFCSLFLTATYDKQHKKYGLLVPIIVCVACILPGAIETRFFLPLYLALFGAAATRFEWASLYKQLRSHPAPLILSYMIVVVLSLAITSTAMAELRHSWP